MKLPSSLSQIIRKYSAGLHHFQGAGGNYSCKAKGILAIKTSGVTAEGGLEQTPSLLRLSDGETLNKQVPSMEWRLHSALPHKYVVHTHSWSALLDGFPADEIFEPFATLLNVEYANPGWSLFKKVSEILGQSPAGSDLVLKLKCHGFVFASNDSRRLARLMKVCDASQLEFAKDLGLDREATSLREPSSEETLPSKLPPNLFTDEFPWATTPDTSLALHKQLKSSLSKTPFSAQRVKVSNSDPHAMDHIRFVIWLSNLENLTGSMSRIPAEDLQNLQQMPEERFRFNF